MAKLPTVTLVTSGHFSTATLNANFTALRDAFTNSVSRDGSAPNAMAGDLDMNGNDILNVGTMDIANLTIDNVDINNFFSGSNGAAADLNAITFVAGDIIYYDGTNLVRLPVGTNGQVLKLASGAPAWGTDDDTDTVGITVEEDDSSVQTNVTVLNFVTGGAGIVTSPSPGVVEVDLDTFVNG